MLGPFSIPSPSQWLPEAHVHFMFFYKQFWKERAFASSPADATASNAHQLGPMPISETAPGDERMQCSDWPEWDQHPPKHIVPEEEWVPGQETGHWAAKQQVTEKAANSDVPI